MPKYFGNNKKFNNTFWVGAFLVVSYYLMLRDYCSQRKKVLGKAVLILQSFLLLRAVYVRHVQICSLAIY